jgi:hypothetical protein
MDMNEPFEPIDRNEFSDHSDKREVEAADVDGGVAWLTAPSWQAGRRSCSRVG